MQIADALRLAIRHFNAGRDADGAAVCSHILGAEPGNPVAHMLLARLAFRTGNPAACLEHLRASLSAAPDYVPARELHARLLADDADADPSDGIRAYRRLLVLAPGQWGGWYDYGNLLHARLDDPAAAMPSYRRALALAPTEDRPATNLATAQLKAGDAEAALQACRQVLDHSPFHIRAHALETVALYDLGRTAEADRLVGWNDLVQASSLPAPDGFADMAAFNAAFAEAIRSHPNRRDDWDPNKRAIRGGAVVTDLLQSEVPAIRAFGSLLTDALAGYVRSLPDDPDHPHVRSRPSGYALDVWANILVESGHQTGHIHNLGWLSGVYYVEMPAAVRDGDDDREGWIEFNRPGYGIPDLGHATVHTLRPEPGMLILFPSYVWHRTVPFSGLGERISVAFDLHPR